MASRIEVIVFDTVFNPRSVTSQYSSMWTPFCIKKNSCHVFKFKKNILNIFLRRYTSVENIDSEVSLRLCVPSDSLIAFLFRFHCSASDRGAEYCDERVCLSVCLSLSVSVCLSAIISPELHVRSSPTFSACYLWPWLGPPLAA